MKKLINWNIHGYCLYFINFLFLEKPSLGVKVNGVTSDLMYLKNSIAQGSVIILTLFIIMMNDILQSLHSPLKARLFANDLVIYSKNKNVNKLKSHKQQLISRLEQWSEKRGFTLSTSKTKFIIFFKREVTNIPVLQLYGEQYEKTLLSFWA